MVTTVVARARALDRRTQERVTFAVGTMVVTGFVLARFFVAAHDQLSRFVVAGSDWVSRPRAPGYLYVFPHAEGYDGQFYWRLAVDPAQLHLRAYMGVRFDSAYRLNRIFFPAVVWVLSFGRAHLVALVMIVVNVVAILALLALGLRIVRRQSRSPAWALLLLCVPGLVGSLSRDLTETLMCCLGLAAIIAIHEGRTVIAAACFSAALLTRETMLVAVAVYAVVALAAILRRQRRPGVPDLAWVVPLIVFALWQVVVRLDAGTIPVLSSAGSGDIGVPFVGLAESLRSWFSPVSGHQVLKGLYYCAQTVTVIALVTAAWRNRHRARAIELVTVGAFVVLLILETKQGWIQPFDARYASFPMVLAWSQLLEGGDRPLVRRTAWVAVPVVCLTVMWRIAVI